MMTVGRITCRHCCSGYCCYLMRGVSRFRVSDAEQANPVNPKIISFSLPSFSSSLHPFHITAGRLRRYRSVRRGGIHTSMTSLMTSLSGWRSFAIGITMRSLLAHFSRHRPTIRRATFDQRHNGVFINGECWCMAATGAR